MGMINEFKLSEVTLKDRYQMNAFKKETDYLCSLDADRLLAGFRETAGIDMRGVERYAGWESLLIGGHTLGHYLTACAMSFETSNSDIEVKNILFGKMKAIIEGLDECQEVLGTGLIFGAKILDKNNVELQFDNVEKGLTQLFTESWVPWYTMHKIIEGLVSVCGLKNEAENIVNKCSKNSEGVTQEFTVAEIVSLSDRTLKVLSKLADWCYGRTGSWSSETHRTVLNIEYGGMNDCLYKVYQLTGKKEHLEAAHAFDDEALFERILAAKPGDDALNNMHANTNIPKFMGALQRYMTVGDEKYLPYVEKFWELVTSLHTYITGGNSEWEHFGRDRILNAERTNCNCETCNIYNMLKISKDLFRITGDKKYADWYENAFINQILSSQNPTTGMTTYFQAMASGYFKTYGERESKFWCCVGSGMENFSKLGESYYFYSGNTVIVNQFFSSELKTENIWIEQCAEFPEKDSVSFVFRKPFDGTLAIRKPDWLADTEEVFTSPDNLNDNKRLDIDEKFMKDCGGDEVLKKLKGYILLNGKFAEGEHISIEFPMKITAYNLPDGGTTYGFKYGPVVLSALLGSDNMTVTKTGVDVTIPENKLIPIGYTADGSEMITVKNGDVASFIENINDNMEKIASNDEVAFRLLGTDSNLTYVTHYRQHTQRYGLYFEFKA